MNTSDDSESSKCIKIIVNLKTLDMDFPTLYTVDHSLVPGVPQRELNSITITIITLVSC